ncbi:peptide/nickel transport system substrate-binding protein/oligopeptide transport system substrate-binding protein [Streptomyces sp. 3213]|uniref:peptide ABC transporter substrate-binding protein n=1 Tax=Streptomyces sp. 3213.3 TaxID=1855348 RepID=UPI000895740E|nr:ABC transporter substrate-binding protein [Streptomyces sp. 3213.3]SEE42260.1 peptide/nickel transport system substrate-binding protein/oligopeptide transport system substrate-binding protein [Streptomyces sp. 3213] [Streptomyces sp. 3213.3]
MRGAKSAKWVAIAAVVALGATACGGGGDDNSSGGSKGNGIVSVEIGEPQNSLVPSNTYETEGGQVINALFTGLTKLDADNKVVNAMAESIESKDNKVWTIKLKSGYTFHNGEKVTAQSFADAWNYGANQTNAQQTNPLFSHIAGYAALNPGEGKKPATDKLSGLKVVDDSTLQVTLDGAFSAFPSQLSFTAFVPLPKAFFKDPKGFGEAPIGNGPFEMKGTFKHNQEIDTVKYDKYPDASKIEVKGVNFKIYSNVDTAYKDLVAGNLDSLLTIPTSGLPTYHKDLDGRYIDEADSAVGYIGFPIKYNKAFQNADLRKAISMSIDRKTISSKIFLGARTPADDYISPIIDGYRKGACGESCTYNPTKAKELYKQSGGLPGNTLEIGYNADGGHKEWVEAVSNQIQQALGIKVTAKPFEQFQTILNDLDAKKYQGAFRMAWSMDYPDMEDYLRPIFSKDAIANGSNYSGYTNEAFEQLLVQGDQAPTHEDAIKKYQAADDVLLKDLPYIPVYFYTLNAGYSDKIKSMKIAGHQILWDTVKLS